MAYRWGKVEAVTDFIFLGSKITVVSDCGHEIKRLLGRKLWQTCLLLLLSRFSRVRLCMTPQMAAHQAPPSLGFSRIQARTLAWVAISFSNAWKWKVKVKSVSHVQLLVTPWTAAYQAPPSMEFSRQEYWSGLPLPSPMTKLNNALKSKYITLPAADCIVKATIFPVVM